jgi:prepilin-type processing-associated H-X9-DG protein
MRMLIQALLITATGGLAVLSAWLLNQTDSFTLPYIALILGTFGASLAMAIFAARMFPIRTRLAAGSALSLLAVLTWCAAASLIPLAVWNRREGVACISNMKQLGLAFSLYSEDHGGWFPPNGSWRDGIAPYSLREIRCPISGSPWTYGMNRALSGKNVAAIKEPSSLVVLFEANAEEENFSGGPLDWVRRHDGRGTLGFADGHARLVDRTVAARFRWQLSETEANR